jgi:hypothetical protein
MALRSLLAISTLKQFSIAINDSTKFDKNSKLVVIQSNGKRGQLFLIYADNGDI